MPRIERSGDDLYFLYTGGTTGMPKGVMWRNEDLIKVLADSGYALAGARRPSEPEEAGRDRQGRGRRRRRAACTSRRRR